YYSLLRNSLGNTFFPTRDSFDSTGTILTLQYAGLSEGLYSLTLFSGMTGGHLADLAGHALDGEFRGSFPSGDGIDGGNFSIRFMVETPIATLPAFTPKLPAGSLIYTISVSAYIDWAGDIDRYAVTLDAGQTVSVLLKPIDPKLQPVVEIRNVNDVVL